MYIKLSANHPMKLKIVYSARSSEVIQYIRYVCYSKSDDSYYLYNSSFNRAYRLMNKYLLLYLFFDEDITLQEGIDIVQVINSAVTPENFRNFF